MGHSATAYRTAKERLESKFGGHHHCQIALYLEEVDNFRRIYPGNYKEIAKFADLLDITIVNLKEANRSEKLNGLLYLKLQSKLPTSMLSSYHPWIFEKHNHKSVETMREWVLQEAEFQTKTLEAVHGLTNAKQGRLEMRKYKKDNPHTFFGRSDSGTE